MRAIRLVNRRCYVWYKADEPPSGAAIERLHCQGYDHVGETTMCYLLKNRGQSPIK